MRRSFESEECQFCTPDPTLNTIICEDANVMCWEVPEEYLRKETLERHLLIVPKRHVRAPWELGIGETISMYKARNMLSTLFVLKGGITATRFGDMSLNAGTVPHLHENIYVPNGQGEFRIPVVKDPSDRASNAERMEEFARRYEDGDVP